MINSFFLPIALQLILVVAPDWNSTDGTLFRYQRSTSNEWELVGSPIPVTLGKNGICWGRGEHEEEGCSVEGDSKSPAGIFFLGPVFGDKAHQSFSKNMPFLLITDDLECVDDPKSSYYNQFVTSKTTEKPDWNSSEKMKEIGVVYDLGMAIQDNTNPVAKGKGSCIFMHIWRGEGRPTAGCTAMEEKDIEELVSWLNEANHPCLVQLPEEEYLNKKEMWGLPDISTVHNTSSR